MKETLVLSWGSVQNTIEDFAIKQHGKGEISTIKTKQR